MLNKKGDNTLGRRRKLKPVFLGFPLIAALLFLLLLSANISPVNASSLEILSPKEGSIITSTTVTINISYSHSISPPDPETGKHDECWAIDYFVQKSGQPKQHIARRDVPNASGTESITVDLAGAAEGEYQIEAVLI
jgi:hypothetical protein